MLVGGARVRAFGPRDGIPMEAARTNVYHAPASRADITRSILIHINHPYAKKRGASMLPTKI